MSSFHPRRGLVLVALALCGLWTISCSNSNGSDDAGSCDADVASDADASADGDADVDGDADGDSDADVTEDADFVEDADLDTDVEEDADVDVELPSCRAPSDRPLRIFFIGNSFTLGGPIPTLVHDLAVAAGWPEPEVEMSAVGGYTLSRHRELESTLAGIEVEGWDFVVLQEYSTGPTDNAGNPTVFKLDATWFYDQFKINSPEAMVVLYETWARHPDHSIYPGTFANPEEMQAQLRFHYNDAADNFIPTHSTAAITDDVVVAPAGDVWERHLAEADAIRLHGSDDYHAGSAGQYLNALVIYSTIYGCRTEGLPGLGITDGDAARLQVVADTTTGEVGVPPDDRLDPLAVGESVQLDCGELLTTDSSWNNLESASGAVINARTTAGDSRAIDIVITDSFAGANPNGVSSNDLGYPSTVSSDVLWTGSFDGHEAGMSAPAQVAIRDLAAGLYRVEVFASRTGDDSGAGRLTRYSIDDVWQDLEVADNRSEQVLFAEVSPNEAGTILLDIEVSPAGTSRFAYLGALVISREL